MHFWNGIMQMGCAFLHFEIIIFIEIELRKEIENYIAQVNILNVKFQFSFKRPIRQKLNEKKNFLIGTDPNFYSSIFINIRKNSSFYASHLFDDMLLDTLYIYLICTQNAYRRTGYEKFNTFTNGNEMESSILIFTFHQQKSYQNVRKSALNEKNQL